MTKLLLLLALLQAIPSTASADPLRILGRGVQDRRTGESIALACVGPIANRPCDQLQFVEFNSDRTFDYIGYTYVSARDQAIDPAALSGRITENVQDRLKEERRERRRANRKEWKGLVFMSGGMLGGIAIGTVLNSFFPVAIPTVAIILCASKQCDPAIFDFLPSLSGDVFSSEEGFRIAVLDQKGWNWASSPKPISHKNFGRLRELLRFGNGMVRALDE